MNCSFYHADIYCTMEESALPLPITCEARQIAQEFASQQPTLEKAEQVRLNTLAVLVVNNYLQMLGFDTNLPTSDSWIPTLRLCADIADLRVTGIGRLECRPLAIDAKVCSIPPEVWEDRIGYLVVRIDEASGKATLLGFAQKAAPELLLEQLEPLEALIDYLHNLISALNTSAPTQGNLWLRGVFEQGWQTVEALLDPTELSLSMGFRSMAQLNEPKIIPTELSIASTGVKRAKLIQLGSPLLYFVLAVELQPEEKSSPSLPQEPRMNIRLQLHPFRDQIYLPVHLRLVVLDGAGETFLEASARGIENYIQLQFSGMPGERFSVKVAFNGNSVIEPFIL